MSREWKKVVMGIDELKIQMTELKVSMGSSNLTPNSGLHIKPYPKSSIASQSGGSHPNLHAQQTFGFSSNSGDSDSYSQPIMPKSSAQLSNLEQHSDHEPYDCSAQKNPQIFIPQPMSNINTSKLPMSISELLPHLIKNQYITPTAMETVPNSFAKNYNPNDECEFHMGAVGHSTEECKQLREEIDNLISGGVLTLEVMEQWKSDSAWSNDSVKNKAKVHPNNDPHTMSYPHVHFNPQNGRPQPRPLCRPLVNSSTHGQPVNPYSQSSFRPPITVRYPSPYPQPTMIQPNLNQASYPHHAFIQPSPRAHPTTRHGAYQKQPKKKTPKELDPIPISYTKLFALLLKKNLVVVQPLVPLQPPYPDWYNPKENCEFHGGITGHSIEGCTTFKRPVLMLINAKWFDHSKIGNEGIGESD